LKFLWDSHDGGKESNVKMWGVESKRFGSVLLLCFGKGSREAYHTHAFNSVSWLLTGGLKEDVLGFGPVVIHLPSLWSIKTYRATFHKVSGMDDSNWVLTFRGPWAKTWREYRVAVKRFVQLTHSRKEV
jgi:hypothetical protein